MKTLANMSELWFALEHKFCESLSTAFSARDIEAWLEHFHSNMKIDIQQFGRDVTGKVGSGQTIKVFTGGWFNALRHGRLPMKIAASALFKRLDKEGYSHSHMYLDGVRFVEDNSSRAQALVSFDRFNQQGENYMSAVVVYDVSHNDNTWLINRLMNYDAITDLPPEHSRESYWQPED